MCVCVCGFFSFLHFVLNNNSPSGTLFLHLQLQHAYPFHSLGFSNAFFLFPVSIITHSLFYSLPLPLLPSLLIEGGQRGSGPSVYCNLTPALTSWTLQEEEGRYIPTTIHTLRLLLIDMRCCHS